MDAIRIKILNIERSKMAEQGATTKDGKRLEEVKRIQVSDSVEAVVSKSFRGEEFTGYLINKFVKSEKFTGHTRATFIPEDMLSEFLSAFDKEDLEFALSMKK